MVETDFTIADVLAWARTKPADEAYDFSSNTDCGLCHFLRDTGRAAAPRVVPKTWRDGWEGERHSYPYVLNCALSYVFGPATFGGLAHKLAVVAAHERELTALLPDDDCTPEFAGRFRELLARPAPEPSKWTKADAYLTDIEQVDA